MIGEVEPVLRRRTRGAGGRIGDAGGHGPGVVDEEGAPGLGEPLRAQFADEENGDLFDEVSGPGRGCGDEFRKEAADCRTGWGQPFQGAVGPLWKRAEASREKEGDRERCVEKAGEGERRCDRLAAAQGALPVVLARLARGVKAAGELREAKVLGVEGEEVAPDRREVAGRVGEELSVRRGAEAGLGYSAPLVERPRRTGQSEEAAVEGPGLVDPAPPPALGRVEGGARGRRQRLEERDERLAVRGEVGGGEPQAGRRVEVVVAREVIVEAEALGALADEAGGGPREEVRKARGDGRRDDALPVGARDLEALHAESPRARAYDPRP